MQIIDFLPIFPGSGNSKASEEPEGKETARQEGPGINPDAALLSLSGSKIPKDLIVTDAKKNIAQLPDIRLEKISAILLKMKDGFYVNKDILGDLSEKLLPVI